MYPKARTPAFEVIVFHDQLYKFFSRLGLQHGTRAQQLSFRLKIT